MNSIHGLKYRDRVLIKSGLDAGKIGTVVNARETEVDLEIPGLSELHTISFVETAIGIKCEEKIELCPWEPVQKPSVTLPI